MRRSVGLVAACLLFASNLNSSHPTHDQHRQTKQHKKRTAYGWSPEFNKQTNTVREYDSYDEKDHDPHREPTDNSHRQFSRYLYRIQSLPVLEPIPYQALM